MAKERDPDLNEEEYIRLDEIREEHWRDVAYESDDKKNIHALKWEVYVQEKEELIKSFFVSVTHPRGEGCLDLCEGSYHR